MSLRELADEHDLIKLPVVKYSMDIREHYITSFFFHVIALLLAAALMRSHTGASDVFSVSLSADTFEKSSMPAKNSNEISHKIDALMPQTASENTVIDEATNPLDEVKHVEEKAEPVQTNNQLSDESLPAASGMPGTMQDVARLAQIHHTYYAQAGAFMDNLSKSIIKGLNMEIQMDATGSLRQGTAQVAFYFNDEGGLGELWGATDSLVFKSALNHLDWRAVPLPGSYNLRIRGLLVNIIIANGEPTISFSFL